MNWVSAFYHRYAALGYSVIPIKTLAYGKNGDAKHPLVKWKEFQTKAATPEQLQAWATRWPLAGIGILTGLFSDLLVVDDDRKGRPPLEPPRSGEQELAFQELVRHYGSESEVARMYHVADEFCEALAQLPTAIAKTGKGKHYYFRMPRDENGFQVAIGDSVKFLPGLDTRAEGGYVLAPPSIHPSGTAYVWERSPEDGILPVPHWVLKAIGGTSNFMRYVPDYVEPSAPGTLRASVPQPKWLQGQFGVNEGERNNTAASVAGKILYGLPEEIQWDRGFDAFMDWNDKNNPSLGVRELRTTWNSVCDSERKKRGTVRSKLMQPLIFGADPELLTAKAISILDLHAPDYAVKDFIVDGTTQLFGKPKAGKSFLAMQIALAVAGGWPLFKSTASMYAYANHPGGFATQQGDVLYLALEDSVLRLKTRMKLILEGREHPARLEFSNQWENCHDGGLGRIERWLMKVPKPRLVVVDTIAAFMGASGGEKPGGSVFRAEYRMFRPIWELGQRWKVPFVLVDHASKSKGKFGSGDPFDSGAGTLGSQAAVDTVMIMEHDEKRPMARLNLKGRDIERGFIDLEHTKDSPVWKLASEPITQESTEAAARKKQASEAHQNGKIARSVDPFTVKHP